MTHNEWFVVVVVFVMVRKIALHRMWLDDWKNPQPYLVLLAVLVVIGYD